MWTPTTEDVLTEVPCFQTDDGTPRRRRVTSPLTLTPALSILPVTRPLCRFFHTQCFKYSTEIEFILVAAPCDTGAPCACSEPLPGPALPSSVPGHKAALRSKEAQNSPKIDAETKAWERPYLLSTNRRENHRVAATQTSAIKQHKDILTN